MIDERAPESIRYLIRKGNHTNYNKMVSSWIAFCWRNGAKAQTFWTCSNAFVAALCVFTCTLKYEYVVLHLSWAKFYGSSCIGLLSSLFSFRSPRGETRVCTSFTVMVKCPSPEVQKYTVVHELAAYSVWSMNTGTPGLARIACFEYGPRRLFKEIRYLEHVAVRSPENRYSSSEFHPGAL